VHKRLFQHAQDRLHVIPDRSIFPQGEIYHLSAGYDGAVVATAEMLADDGSAVPRRPARYPHDYLARPSDGTMARRAFDRSDAQPEVIGDCLLDFR
jgi:hypothetical protein